MEKYRNFSLFIILIPIPDFPHFYYKNYVRWKFGVTFVRGCFHDDLGLIFIVFGPYILLGFSAGVGGGEARGQNLGHL